MQRAKLTNLAFSVLAALTLLAGGCSSFNRDWQAAAARPIAPDDIQGRWQGTWQSRHNGHTGPLRCILTKAGDGRYEAKFHARYKLGITLSAGYTTELAVTRTNGAHAFTGAENLGWYAGGVYEYAGTVSSTNFFSTYRCKWDHGTFQMTRP